MSDMCRLTFVETVEAEAERQPAYHVLIFPTPSDKPRVVAANIDEMLSPHAQQAGSIPISSRQVLRVIVDTDLAASSR